MPIIKLDRLEQIELLKKESLDKIKEVYRPLAKSVAEKYLNELTDIALETIEVARRKYLVKSADKFKFDTYATYWFKKAIEEPLGIEEENEIEENEEK